MSPANKYADYSDKDLFYALTSGGVVYEAFVEYLHRTCVKEEQELQTLAVAAVKKPDLLPLAQERCGRLSMAQTLFEEFSRHLKERTNV